MNSANLADREQFYADILTTAIECLGVTPWATVLEYRWYEPLLPADAQGGGTPAPNGGGHVYAKLWIEEDETEFEVSNQILSDAFRLVLLREDYAPSNPDNPRDGSWVETPLSWGYLPSLEWRERMLQARRENDAGDVDAADADMLVQLAVWHAVVFG